MTHDPAPNPWYRDPLRLFAGAGFLAFALLWWLSARHPDVTLTDGVYSCQASTIAGEPIEGPTVTVEGGQVVDAWDYSPDTGARTPLPFGEVQNVDPKKFTMTSINVNSGFSSSFVCVLA